MAISKDFTLGDIREICSRHQKHGRDCETCTAYDFCMYQMTARYPSAWVFEKDKNENEKGA